MAETMVANTIVLRIRLFKVAELTSWGFNSLFRLLDVYSQRPVVHLCFSKVIVLSEPGISLVSGVHVPLRLPVNSDELPCYQPDPQIWRDYTGNAAITNGT